MSFNKNKNGRQYKKLALSDDILMSIEKPARYIGGELNSVYKDLDDIKIRFAMCFPDVYEIGMSHLGMAILCKEFNLREDVYCERVFSPWPDLDKVMRKDKIKLFTLETQTPVKEMDFLGITLAYEMAYTNILQVLDLSNIPIWQKDRVDDDTFVIVGGPCTYNPEPIADFIDIAYIGEGEVSFYPLFDLYNSMKEDGSYTRESFLREASKIPGLYVPSLYEVKYNDDGTISSHEPIFDDVPKVIKKQVIVDLENAPYPTRPVVPFVQATQDRATLEIQRGCIHGCRFCQAGMTYRPNREKSLDVLKAQAVEILDSTGYDEMSLSSLSSSDYTRLPELVDFLIEECSKRHVNISLPSLRIDSFALDVMKKVQDIRKVSLTFAPEGGSQRMRDIINKGITEDEILSGASMAFEAGWNKVKLYFMLGQPNEMEDDMRAIPILANEIAKKYYEIPKEERNGKVAITISTSFFVPKPFTSFQWAGMYSKDEYLRRARIVTDEMNAQLNRRSMKYNYHEADVTLIEGLLARGDRKLSKLIHTVYSKGQIFDAWTENFDFNNWTSSMQECGVTFDFYCYRQREVDELLPWDFIDSGIRKEYLIDEWERSKVGEIIPHCNQKCSACGAMSYGGGVCYAS